MFNGKSLLRHQGSYGMTNNVIPALVYEMTSSHAKVMVICIKLISSLLLMFVAGPVSYTHLTLPTIYSV